MSLKGTFPALIRTIRILSWADQGRPELTGTSSSSSSSSALVEETSLRAISGSVTRDSLVSSRMPQKSSGPRGLSGSTTKPCDSGVASGLTLRMLRRACHRSACSVLRLDVAVNQLSVRAIELVDTVDIVVFGYLSWDTYSL